MITLFTDGFLHRLLPFHHEVTLNATRQFDLAAYQQQAPIAAAGALLASVVLYAIGIWLRRMPARVSTEAQQARIETLRKTALEWLPYLLILSPTPVGGILIMAAGFFGLRPIVAAVAITAAEVAWRAAPLL